MVSVRDGTVVHSYCLFAVVVFVLSFCSIHCRVLCIRDHGKNLDLRVCCRYCRVVVDSLSLGVIVLHLLQICGIRLCLNV